VIERRDCCGAGSSDFEDNERTKAYIGRQSIGVFGVECTIAVGLWRCGRIETVSSQSKVIDM